MSEHHSSTPPAADSSECEFLRQVLARIDRWFDDDANLDDLDHARALLRERLASTIAADAPEENVEGGDPVVALIATELHRLRRAQAAATVITRGGYTHDRVHVQAVHRHSPCCPAPASRPGCCCRWRSSNPSPRSAARSQPAHRNSLEGRRFPMTSVTLWFPLSKVLDLAEHAMAASQHSRSPYADPGPAVPALIWVKDQGIYLMSNGIPHQPGEPDSPDYQARVVYALDHGPGTHWIHGEPLGDDFAEYLDLIENFDGHTLIELIRTYAARNGWFAIIVSPSSFEMMFSPTPPTLTPSSGANHRPSRRAR